MRGRVPGGHPQASSSRGHHRESLTLHLRDVHVALSAETADTIAAILVRLR